jgi:putative tricarboxylic transport membrane protein
MHFRSRIARAAPYAVLLAVAAWLFLVAGRIDYVGPAERIGPTFWPKAILGLLALLCAYEIVKSLLFSGPRSVSGVLQALMEEAAAGSDDAVPVADAQPSLARLAAGMAATLAYVLTVEWLGFFVATAAFLAAFVLIGGYRRWGVALAVGGLGSLGMVVIFMRVVYISLPLGAGPFRTLSLALLAALGVR